MGNVCHAFIGLVLQAAYLFCCCDIGGQERCSLVLLSTMRNNFKIPLLCLEILLGKSNVTDDVTLPVLGI